MSEEKNVFKDCGCGKIPQVLFCDTFIIALKNFPDAETISGHIMNCDKCKNATAVLVAYNIPKFSDKIPLMFQPMVNAFAENILKKSKKST